MQGVMVIKTVDCWNICLFMWAMKWSQQRSVLLSEQLRFKRVFAFLKGLAIKGFHINEMSPWQQCLLRLLVKATNPVLGSKKKQQPETAILSCTCAAPGRLYQRIGYISAHTDGLHLRYRWDVYRKAEWDKPWLAWLWRQRITCLFRKQVMWLCGGKLITNI